MRRVGFFFLFCHLSQKQNTVSLKVCPLGRYGLYVESIFSHCLAVSSVFLALVVTHLYAKKNLRQIYKFGWIGVGFTQGAKSPPKLNIPSIKPESPLYFPPF